MFAIRKRLFEREGAPPDTRYNEDTDTVETSTDGGVTWTPNPGADPRTNPAYLLPPNTAPNVKCAAAEGMVVYVRQVVTAGIDGTTLAGVGNLVLAAILIFLPVSWFFALIALAAEALIAIGGAALSFSFTEDIYDQLRCVFLDHVDADGRLDAAALTAAQSDVDAIGDVTVSAVFELIVKMAGHVGLSNAGAKYADPEAECECAEKWCRMYDFRIDPYQFEIEETGVWTLGVGFETEQVQGGDDSFRYVVIRTDDFDTSITNIEFGFVYEKGAVTSGGGNTAIGVFNVGFSQTFFNYTLDAIPPVPDSPLFWEDAGTPEGMTSLFVQLITGILVESTDDPGGVGTIVYLKVCGVGEPPTGGVECECWE